MRLERVVVGVDFDEPSLETARWVVRDFAPDAEHVLVHALDLRDPPRYLDTRASVEAMLEDGRREATRRLEELAAEGRGSTAVEVRTGRPDEVLSSVAEQADADLIVVGRGSGGDGRLGGTAEKLVNAAAVPVLMVPTPPSAAPEQILAAVDDSPETADVLSSARSLAARHEAHVTVVHVFHSVFAGLGDLVAGRMSGGRLKQDQRDQARAWLEEEVRDAGFDPGQVTLELREGDPATQILADDRAPRPDLIITGNRGPGAVQKALLGNVASSVVRAAARPVLVLRPG